MKPTNDMPSNNENQEQEGKWYEGDVFWKIIFSRLTSETMDFISQDVSKRLAESHARGVKEGMDRTIDAINEWAADARDKIAPDTNSFNLLNDETKESYWIAMNSTMKFISSLKSSLK